MDRETAGKMRGMVRRCVLKNVRDDGQTQRCSVEVAEGIWRDDVEVMHPFGFTGSSPEDGALAIVMAVAGDEGDLVALPVANPSARMGGLAEGEVGVSNAFGDKIVLGADGTIRISGGSSIVLSVDGVELALSGAGVTITGGKVTHDGKNIGATHVHGGIVPGGALTDVPEAAG